VAVYFRNGGIFHRNMHRKAIVMDNNRHDLTFVFSEGIGYVSLQGMEYNRHESTFVTFVHPLP